MVARTARRDVLRRHEHHALLDIPRLRARHRPRLESCVRLARVVREDGVIDRLRGLREAENLKRFKGVTHMLMVAKEPVPQEICEAYGVDAFEFGKEYIIPKPMDVRLLEVVPAAVARAAVDSGVARNPYPAHYPLKSMDDII